MADSPNFDLEKALPALPDISWSDVIGAGMSASGAPGASVAGSVVSGASDVKNKVTGSLSGFLTWIQTFHWSRVVAVAAGLVLIAAGVFSFSRVQDTVKQVVKAAA